MPKFKAEYLFNKIYDFDGVKEIEAKDIKEAIEKFKKAIDLKDDKGIQEVQTECRKAYDKEDSLRKGVRSKAQFKVC